MKKYIKRTIIIGMIGVVIGILKVFFSNYLAYKIPPQAFDNMLKNTPRFFLLSVPMPFWLILSLLILLVRLFFILRKINNAERERAKKETKSVISKVTTNETKKNTLEELSKEEKDILIFLTENDGREMYFSDIQKRIGSNIRTRHAIEELQRKHFITAHGSSFSFLPAAYILDRKGRELIVNLNLDKK